MSGVDALDEICTLWCVLTRAMVSKPDCVEVTHAPVAGVSDDHRIISVRVDSADIGKLIGKQGRVARALRVALKAVGKNHGYSLQLDIEGVSIEE